MVSVSFGFARSIFMLRSFIMTKRDSSYHPHVFFAWRLKTLICPTRTSQLHRACYGFPWSGLSSSISTLHPCSSTPASTHYASRGSSATNWSFYHFQGDRTSLALRTPVHLGPCGGDGCTWVYETQVLGILLQRHHRTPP